MDIGLTEANELLAGAALFLVTCIVFTRARKRNRRRRRAKPAYPTAPHTTKMWANQPVSAPATRAQELTDHAWGVSAESNQQLIVPINPNGTIL